MDNSDFEKIVTNMELSKKLHQAHPEIKTVLSWQVIRGCQVGGAEVTVGKKKHFEIIETSRTQSGLNYFALKFVDEIFPAYTMQEIIHLYSGDKKVLTADQLADRILSQT